MATPVIEFKNFTLRYASQKKPTLHDINLTIRQGEKVLILGPSGSGKSTLGNCLNGLLPFSTKAEFTGSVKVAGLETREQSIHKLSAHVGTVMQDSDCQFAGLTVGEDVAFSLENDRVLLSSMCRSRFPAGRSRRLRWQAFCTTMWIFFCLTNRWRRWTPWRACRPLN